MADITVSKLNKYYGAEPVLIDVSLDIHEGEKVALIGENGAGKTTLFKIIAGILDFDSGEVNVAKNKKFGIIDQIPIYPDGYSTLDVLKTAFADIDRLNAELSELENLLEKGDKTERVLERYGKVQMMLESMDAYSTEISLQKVCNGLAIDEEMLGKQFNILSGGEKTRVNLCRMILENTDILLLDEPTNHLDLASVEWLGKYLSTYKGTVFTISHDRYFLDECIDRIIEIRHHKAEFYEGAYSYYAVERERRDELLEEQHKREAEELRRLLDQSRKMHQWGTERMHKRAFSIDKRIAKMKVTDRPKKTKSISVKFGDVDYHTEELIKVREVAKGFDERTLFKELSFVVRNGDRLAIVGDNGAGKSTLLKIILKELQQDSGKIVYADGLKIGYLPQEVRFAHPERNLVDTLIYEKDITAQSARNRLGAFKFHGEDVFKPITTLSGGEKSRLRLCTLMYDKINLLFLDEPTNHLDIKSREWIEETLEDFIGTIIFVSHDRYFISRFANRILEISPSGVMDFKGSYEAYRKYRENNPIVLEAPVKENKADKAEKPPRDKKGGDKMHKKRQVKLERDIEKLEEELSAFDARLEEVSSDHEKLAEVMALRTVVEDNLMALMEEWEEVSSLLES